MASSPEEFLLLFNYKRLVSGTPFFRKYSETPFMVSRL
jgi:hypothetical protein